MQIKVNNVTISVESFLVTSGNLAIDDLDKQSIMLSKESEDIYKMIKLYDIMSNVKAVESFGYKSTEGVGEKIKHAASEIWKKIKEFFINIGKFFKRLGEFIVGLFGKKRIKPGQEKKAKQIDDFIKSNKLSKESETSENEDKDRIKQMANKIINSDIISNFWNAAGRRVYLEGSTFLRGTVDRGLLYDLSFKKPTTDIFAACERIINCISKKEPIYDMDDREMDFYYKRVIQSNENDIASYAHSDDNIDNKYNTLCGFIYANDRWNVEGIPGYKKHIDYINSTCNTASRICDDLKDITQDEDPDIIKKRTSLSKITKILTVYGNALNKEMKARIAVIDLINSL